MIQLNDKKSSVGSQISREMQGLRLNSFERRFLSSVMAWEGKHFVTQKQVDAVNRILTKAEQRGTKARCEDAPCCGCC
jgi:hypothetical protein